MVIVLIGTILKIMRKQNNLSQKELGKLLNLSDTTISAYELEKISPDFETIIKIFKICKYDFCILDKNKNIIDIQKFINENE